ncbi:MAG: type II toxin-antitoxin system VapB family antitoxin [Gemmatimonadetes bacterium]|nr:type II toxin-antitoxin system VapB family antitoxin [Gemmatimonadota bacterium]
MPTRKATPKAPRYRGGRKKTLRIDQGLLDRARQALGVRTETAAVTQALEAVLRREQQIQGIRTLAALGPIDARRID